MSSGVETNKYDTLISTIVDVYVQRYPQKKSVFVVDLEDVVFPGENSRILPAPDPLIRPKALKEWAKAIVPNQFILELLKAFINQDPQNIDIMSGSSLEIKPLKYDLYNPLYHYLERGHKLLESLTPRGLISVDDITAEHQIVLINDMFPAATNVFKHLKDNNHSITSEKAIHVIIPPLKSQQEYGLQYQKQVSISFLKAFGFPPSSFSGLLLNECANAT